MKDQAEIPEALALAERLENDVWEAVPLRLSKVVMLAAEALRRLRAESELHLQELRSYRITVENREARIAELEATLASDCSRSHPHENMSPMCELRTEIARLTNELAHTKAQLATARPVFSHMELRADGSHGAGRDVAVDTMGREMPSYNPTAAAQQGVHPVLGWVHKLTDGKIGSYFYKYEPHCDNAVRDNGGEKIAVVAATNYTPQGLEQDAARWREALRHIGADNMLGGAQFVVRGLPAPVNVMRGSVAEHFTKAIDAALAAQAKQGS